MYSIFVKSFGQFIKEGVKTAASTVLKMKGLKGDGHGGWYDQKGNFVAKTVNGKLQFTGGRSVHPKKILSLLRLPLPENQQQNQKQLLLPLYRNRNQKKIDGCN